MKEKENSKNKWLIECQEGYLTDESKKVEVLEEILKAEKKKAPELKEIATHTDIMPIFRRNAIRRLVNIKHDMNTATFLRGIFLNQEDDEDVRCMAYEEYRYLKIINHQPSIEQERAYDKSLMPNEKSRRMEWLTSMRD